jgi:hypothetical protein
MELRGTEIIGLRLAGDLAASRMKSMLEVTRQLGPGRGLLPPALAFSFDRGDCTNAELVKVAGESGRLIHFIPRRTYENYLLNPKGIASVLAEADAERAARMSEEHVANWIVANGKKAEYYNPAQGAWLAAVHGAKLLGDLFSTLTRSRVSYHRVKHGTKLTDWIIQNAPSDLSELAAYIRMLLKPEP